MSGATSTPPLVCPLPPPRRVPYPPCWRVPAPPSKRKPQPYRRPDTRSSHAPCGRRFHRRSACTSRLRRVAKTYETAGPGSLASCAPISARRRGCSLPVHPGEALISTPPLLNVLSPRAAACHMLYQSSPVTGRLPSLCKIASPDRPYP